MSRASGRFTLFFILAAAAVVLLVLSSSGWLAPVEGVARAVARPFSVILNGAGRYGDNLLSTARDLTSLRSANQLLLTRIETLTVENLRLKEVAAENQQMRELLRFQQLNPTYDYRGGQVIARVISRSPTNYMESISIDLGRNHGIEPGMPVVTERGLVGRVHQVGPVSSTVLLLTDPSSGVQGLVQRTRAAGVVNGKSGGAPVMEYVPQGAEIEPGDLVITSGLGGNFPKNLVIGQVVEVQQRDFDMFQQAVIRPTVDFNRLEFVLVITNFAPLPGQPDELQSVG